MEKISLLLLIIISCGYVCGIVPVLADELRILTIEEPPASFVNDRGGITGFSVEIVREIQRRINNTDSIRLLPEMRALKIATESPNVVLFSFSRTQERENDFHWIMLLLRKPWVMYSKKGEGIVLKNVEDARKIKSIGVVRGDIRAIRLEQMGFSNLEKVASHELNVKKLQLNRIRMLFYEEMGMSSVCWKLDIPMSEFEPVLKTEPSEVYLMMSRQGTDPKAVRKWRDAARLVKMDGTFQRIAEKWINIIHRENGIVCKVKDGALNF